MMARIDVTRVEISGEDAGIVVRQARGFRFYANAVRFQPINGRMFATIGAAERAAPDQSGPHPYAALP